MSALVSAYLFPIPGGMLEVDSLFHEIENAGFILSRRAWHIRDQEIASSKQTNKIGADRDVALKAILGTSERLEVSCHIRNRFALSCTISRETTCEYVSFSWIDDDFNDLPPEEARRLEKSLVDIAALIGSFLIAIVYEPTPAFCRKYVDIDGQAYLDLSLGDEALLPNEIECLRKIYIRGEDAVVLFHLMPPFVTLGPPVRRLGAYTEYAPILMPGHDS